MMIKQGDSFWSAVYPSFMSRDLTRTDLRKISPDWPGDDERQLPAARAALQHVSRRLQALSELSQEARLPPAVPALPRRAGTLQPPPSLPKTARTLHAVSLQLLSPVRT
jgi:hypothetical protein